MIYLFNLLTFLIGFLILNIQLSVSKTLLPIFGGAPNTWITSLAFYQTVLTLGYFYAYFLQKKFDTKKQIKIHLTLIFFIACLFTPITIQNNYINAYSDATINLFITILFSIGLPYFIVTATSPLLQAWYGNTNLSKSENPYFLYISSNIGTFFALMSYPFLIETKLDNEQQLLLWSFTFISTLAIMIFVFFKIKDNIINTKEKSKEVWHIKKETVFKVIFLSFLGSSLLSSVSLKITTDISPLPLLWILPLGLYFLSFSLAFWDKFKFKKEFNIVTLITSLLSLLLLFNGYHNILFTPILLILLFSATVILHHTIYTIRPPKQLLTIFYLYLSVGGALGGIFIGIISPMIFNSNIEIFLTLFLVAIFSFFIHTKTYIKNNYIALLFLLPIFILIILMILFNIFNNDEKRQVRTFFGVYTIMESEFNHEGENYKAKYLNHGTTNHGAQIIHPEEKRDIPLTYYSTQSPMYLISKNHRNTFNDNKKIGVVGLGTGAINCFFDNSIIDFYEIDPEIISIAQKDFYFLETCKNEINFLVGDARIQMEKTSDNKYSQLFIDAFSSDAIPTHLLTKEAIQLYVDKINDNGIVIIHTSNRYLDIPPVIKNISDALTIYSKVCSLGKSKETLLSSSSEVVVLSKIPMDYLDNDCWKNIPNNNHKTWTDSYNNIFNILKI